MTVHHLEPWLDKKQLAEHYRVTTRWVGLRLADGLPSAKIGGRRKFQLSEVEPWLIRHGHFQRGERG